MIRAIGIVIILCGLAMATISVGGELGYFTILDSGEATSASDLHANALYAPFMIGSEVLLIALGAWLVWTSRTRDAA